MCNMCRPPDIEKEIPAKEPNMKECNNSSTTLTTIVLVSVTFIGGYGLGANDTDIRVTCLIGASGLFLFILIHNLAYIKQQHAPFFRWVSQQTSFSSMSLGRMASKGSLSNLSRVTSVDAIKNISSNLLSSLDCSKKIRSAIQSITRKECFARLDYIERLSINDVSILFRYATDANLDIFDKKSFLDDQTPILRSVVNAMDMAVKVSRGSLSEGIKITSTSGRSEGDVDALRFVAVTRIFAEWRNIRMIPKGYQRYAIGLSLGYRDVLQNLEKIERGVHDYLRHHQTVNKEFNGDTDTPIPSPTLRQLLEFEAITKVHKRLPYVKEKSSASGLLWAKRQLHYQTVLISNSLEVPEFYSSGEEAAKAAYQMVYTEYHGWAVKQIFTRSFGGSPPLDKIWLTMCPPTDSPGNHGQAKSKYKTSGNPMEDSSDFAPSLRTLSDINSASTMSERTERTEAQDDDNEVLELIDNIRIEIVEKWEDLVRMFNCGKEEKRKDRESLILSSKSHFNLNQLDREMVESSFQINPEGDLADDNSVVALSTSSTSSAPLTAESIISRKEKNVQLIKKSKSDAEDFVRGITPMIADLGVLIDQLNMNDPTKA